MSFQLASENVAAWLEELGLAASGAPLDVQELAGGVSATVLAVRGPGLALVVKQALPQLRVSDEWLATQGRTATEAAAMRICDALTPGVVPAVVAVDPVRHVLAMALVEGAAGWQAEVSRGSVHAERGAWAGSTLAAWHRETMGRVSLDETLGGLEPFEEQRLRPFHETVMARRPELAAAIAPYRDSLRSERLCLVHGDYAMKNMLLRGGETWVVDFEVAHLGNPVFDLAFFLSFVVLSAIRWPDRANELRELGDRFLAAYRGGSPFLLDDHEIAGHTGCLVLARTDGKSPAQFLDDASRERAREVGIAMLDAPGDPLAAI